MPITNEIQTNVSELQDLFRQHYEILEKIKNFKLEVARIPMTGHFLDWGLPEPLFPLDPDSTPALQNQ